MASMSTAWSWGPWTWTPCPLISSPYAREVERRRFSSAPTLFPLLATLSLTTNIVFELLDGEVLVGDDVAHDVADGNHADHAPLVHHRQVADVLLRHERHALARLGARAHAHHVGRHDLLDARG